MWLIHGALRRPITVLVIVIAIALTSAFAVTRMKTDIFPNLNLPVIYVAQPYGGMSPAQMEGYLTYYYEYHFLYITGIAYVESKSIQNVALIKLAFHPGTDMSQALAQTIAYVNRAHAFMPYGTVQPFVMRFDAGSVPVGYLVFSSESRSLSEIQDLALNRIRPIFSTLPGVSAPPPFGGNQRTIVVGVDPDRLRAYGMSAEDVIRAVSTGNALTPSGNLRTEELQRLVPSNSVVTDIKDLLDLPIRTGSGPAVYLRDVGTVKDSADILAGYALVNERRAVYIPVTKRADASTLAVVDEVKGNLARFRTLVPDDIKISFEFDQSGFVRGALASVVREGILGALLTGLVVLVFLRDWRSSVIVVITIPFALLTAVVALWGSGQTINIMTLGGLALAVGILVDESTVVIENIHSHLARGTPRARAVLLASREVAVPRFLAMACVLAVFIPSFFMTGVSNALFVPLALAVGFAMAASYFLSSTLVPVLSAWVLREHAEENASRSSSLLSRVRERNSRILKFLTGRRWTTVGLYLLLASGIVVLIGPLLGREIFPRADVDLFQLRFRAPVGTRVNETERLIRSVLEKIRQTAGAGNVEVTLGYVGVHGTSYPINTIFLWLSGPHEAVMQVALRPEAGLSVPDLEERLRKILPAEFPGCEFSFEPGDIVSRILNFGASTPVEIAASGPDLAANRAYVAKLSAELDKIPSLRDLQYEQPLDYPSVNVEIDRIRAGQLGVTVADVGRSLAAATSSSRFVAPNYWADPRSGLAYQVQIEVPQSRMRTIEDLRSTPIMRDGEMHPLLGDIARVSSGTAVGEYDRYNMQRMVTLSANIVGEDLGRTSAKIDQALGRAGAPPRGVTVSTRGQITPMRETLGNLSAGLLVAVVVIFLLLAANFQSMRLALVVMSSVPAVICGVIAALLLTGTTLNIQSFMGAIMAIGVAVANAILLVTFAEKNRREGMRSAEAAVHAALSRMRPILMTSSAMIFGMVPMALAIGSGAEATAPLGRAVIGGLIAATVATLTILPSVFALVQSGASARSASLDPDDPESSFAGQGA